MNRVFAFVIGVPLAAELLGACFSIWDSWRQREARAAAVERLAVPMLCWSGLWWVAGIDAGPALLTALGVVAFWQLIAFYAVRWLGHWRGFQTTAIDTDTEVAADMTRKKSPGDNGDWEGERKSPGR